MATVMFFVRFRRLVCVACGLLPILVFLAMLALPETPPWLVLQVIIFVFVFVESFFRSSFFTFF